MEEIEVFFSGLKTQMTVVHVIGVVFGMGAALLSDLIFNFYSKDKQLSDFEKKTLSFFSTVVWYGLIIIFLSGIGLFLSDTTRYLASTKFLAKMTVLLVLLINGFILNKYIWPHVIREGFFTEPGERSVRKMSFICGMISVVSWLFVCTLGILDGTTLAYSSIVLLYAGLLLIGTPVVLLIEKREFN